MISYLNRNCTVTFSKNEKDFIFLSTSCRKNFVKQKVLSKKKTNIEIIFEITLSSGERESKSAMDSGFKVLDSSLCKWNLVLLGFRIL